MVLELKDITLGYPQGRILAENLSMSVPGGEMVALLGRNGVGKSTLLRALTGVQPPLRGRIVLDGADIFSLSPARRARRIAFVNTEGVTVAHLRVEEVVALGRAPYTGWLGALSAADRMRVGRALELVGMAGFRGKTLDTLSDGERQRVMIARALAQDTPLMVLDEPTAFLDLPNRYQIALLLRRLAHEVGKTVIFSTHDLSTAVQLCDRLWVMSPGGIRSGGPEDLLLDGGIDVMFEDTPLGFSGREVKLSLPPVGSVLLAGEAAGNAMLRHAVQRSGFEPVEARNGALGDGPAIRIERSLGGEFRVFLPDGTKECPDLYGVARALRRAASGAGDK